MTEAAVRDHLANERTLLSWQRTALGVIGLGFLVDRFALGSAGSSVFGSAVGLGLIVLGVLVALVGSYRFRRTEREIDTATYRPSVLANLVLTGAIVIGAAALVVFLMLSPAS
jgi:putative membrane protein